MGDESLNLTEADVGRLFEAARAESYGNFALLVTIYVLALRSTEATLIRRDEVNFQRGYIRVHVLKRSKDKKDSEGRVVQKRKPPPTVDVPVDGTLLDILREHVAQAPSSVWLFPHPRDARKAMTRGLVKYAYWKAATKIGLGEGYVWHPHLLRSARASHKARELAKLGTPPLEAVSEVQKTLRHATSAMAFEYVKDTSESREQAKKADTALIGRLLKRSV